MKNDEQNVVEQPIVAPQPKPEIDKKHMWFLVGIPLIAILILGAFVGGMLWASSQTGSDLVVDDIGDEVEEDEGDEEETDEELEIRYSDVGGELSISWYTKSQRREIDTLVDYDAHDTYRDETPQDMALVIGEVDEGGYVGYELVMHVVELSGLGTYQHHFYTLTDPLAERETVVLSYDYDGGDTSQHWLKRQESILEEITDEIVFDDEATIAQFNLDEKLTATNGLSFIFESLDDTELLATWNDGAYGQYDYTDHDIVGYTTGPGWPIYEIPEGEGNAYTFIVVREDSRMLNYTIEIPFFSYEGLWGRSGTPEIVWNNGDEIGSYIAADAGGCGYTTLTNVVDPFSIPEFLRKPGVASNGDDILEPLPPSTYYDDMFSTWEVWNEGGTRDDFVAMHPIFFWEDDLGRMIQFTHSDALPAAECGKPVIYLYPEEATHMVVEVEPQGGFTYTEPDYGDGWEVIAYPDGYVKNIADNQIYPYLFWEGRGGLYSEPENYWVVAVDEVEPFLVKTLARLGLEGREIAEFNEFWVPRMQDAEYYKIGFHGTEVMDAIAPLTLSVEADSILRILMDYSELDAREPSNPPRFIPHFEREGFVVTEWGGVIR